MKETSDSVKGLGENAVNTFTFLPEIILTNPFIHQKYSNLDPARGTYLGSCADKIQDR